MSARTGTPRGNTSQPASPKPQSRPQSANVSRSATKMIEQIQNSSDKMKQKYNTLNGEDVSLANYPGAIADHAPVFVRKVGINRLNRPKSATITRKEVAADLKLSARAHAPDVEIFDDVEEDEAYNGPTKSSTKTFVRDEYVPDHLKNANYKMDIFELLKDKLDQHSGTFLNSFRRLTKSAGYSGFTIDKEMFKQALIKDFHLFDPQIGSSSEHAEIRKYQENQKRKLDEFIEKSDVNKDGFIRYNDFLRVISDLDRSANQLTTQSQRHSRYASTMNANPEKHMQDKKMQQEMKRTSTDPPFALYNEAEKYDMYFIRKHQEKLQKLRNIFTYLGHDPSSDKVSLEIFKKGIQRFDRYVVDREVEEIIDMLGTRKSGYIDLNEFMNKYAIDILKTKAFRGSFETLYPLQWPGTLEKTTSRAEMIEKLREKGSKNQMKGSISNTRYNVMRADKIKRELISDEYRKQMTQTGYLSPKQRRHVENFLYDHEDHLKDGRSGRMEPIQSPQKQKKKVDYTNLLQRSAKIDTHKYHKPKFIRNPNHLLSSTGAVSLRRSANL
jgi:Ca2+-binding EF-hand superfamily protein